MILTPEKKVIFDELQIDALKASIAETLQLVDRMSERDRTALQNNGLPLIPENQSAEFYMGMFHALRLNGLLVEKAEHVDQIQNGMGAMVGLVALLYRDASEEFPSEIEPDARKG